MRYERIFWLDDNPDFFSWFRWLAEDLGVEFELGELMRRITFAYDYETGKAAVSAKQFDLYVLDGDFPRTLSSARRECIDQVVGQICDGESGILPNDAAARDAVVYNNFVSFYKECLAGRANVVVFSMSYDAIRPACDLRLPFYFKRGTEAEEVTDWMERTKHFHVDEPQLEGWEYGSKKELLERYLV